MPNSTPNENPASHLLRDKGVRTNVYIVSKYFQLARNSKTNVANKKYKVSTEVVTVTHDYKVSKVNWSWD